MGLLDGRKGLILNIANDRSIATHIATHCIQQGAVCGFGFLPMDNIEKSQRRVRKAMEENGFADAFLHPCDVGSDESIERFFVAAKERFGTIDFLVHSLAFANRDYLKKDEGNFTSTPREVFKQAVDISAYSLIALTRAALPLMPNGGSVIGLTYLGSEKVIPGYNVMGVAKAALEATSRYLARDLGPDGIRVNLVAAGPVRTIAARSIPGFEQFEDAWDQRAPLGWNVKDPAPVAAACVALFSDLFPATTGEVVHVDGGYHAIGA